MLRTLKTRVYAHPFEESDGDDSDLLIPGTCIDDSHSGKMNYEQLHKGLEGEAVTDKEDEDRIFRVPVTDMALVSNINPVETTIQTDKNYKIKASLQAFAGDRGSSDPNEVFEEEDNIGAVLDEVRRMYGDELEEKLSGYSKPLSEQVGIPDVERAIDQMAGSESTEHDNAIKSCAKCCRKNRVENVTSFQEGQHIRIPGKYFSFNIGKRLLSVYQHHAIVKQVSKTCGHKAELVLIHFTEVGDNISIHETTETFDLEKDEIYIIEYFRPRYEPDEIVRRAESMLKKTEQIESADSKSEHFSSYNLLARNCEHFASWCIVGKGESFQVQGVRKLATSCLSKCSDVASKLWRFLKRFLLNAPDEIAAGFNTGLNLPGIFLGITALIYLIYCCVMTYKHRKKYKNGEVCKACYKREVIALWTSFGAFCTTSGMSYILLHFCLPALGPFGIPCMLALVVLSIGLQWGISKLRKALLSPFSCDTNPISRLSDISVGDMISYKYFGIPHNAIVTEVHPKNDKLTVGSIRCVHYGSKNWKVFGTREVIEEYLEVDLSKKQMKLVDCKHLNRFPPKQVVEHMRKRVGERKWSPISNRSKHLCFWALVSKDSDNPTFDTHSEDIGESKSKKKSSLRSEQKEVHFRKDLRMGQVVQYEKRRFERNRKEKSEKAVGIVVRLEDAGERKFEMHLIVYQNKYSMLKKCEVDLQTDRLFIQNYHPAHCFSMEERVKSVCQEWGEKCEYRGEKHFLNSCILKQ